MNVAGTNSRGSNGLNRGDGIPIALELSSDPTETIDLGVCRITLYILRSLGYERAA
jgi:hypothetical protein